MSTKIIQIAVDASGQFDADTAFDLGSGRELNSDGILAFEYSTAIGRLNRDSMNDLVGTGGYYIRRLWGTTSNGALVYGSVSIIQPGSKITWDSGNRYVAQTLLQGSLVQGTVVDRSYYVPPGWELVFRGTSVGAEGGTPQNGPTSFTMIVDAPSSRLDAIRSHAQLHWAKPRIQTPTP